MLAVLSALASLAIALILVFLTVVLISVLVLVALAVMAGTTRRLPRLPAIRRPRLPAGLLPYLRDRLGLRPKREETYLGTLQIPPSPSPQPEPAAPAMDPIDAQETEPALRIPPQPAADESGRDDEEAPAGGTVPFPRDHRHERPRSSATGPRSR